MKLLTPQKSKNKLPADYLGNKKIQEKPVIFAVSTNKYCIKHTEWGWGTPAHCILCAQHVLAGEATVARCTVGLSPVEWHVAYDQEFLRDWKELENVD